jgi:hypothetical protein
MTLTNFFNQVDDTARSKQIAQQAQEAKARVNTEIAINFANKLSELTEPYEAEFEKRGFKCQKRTGNLPYFSLEISNPKTAKQIKLSINQNQADRDGYQLATYNQDIRTNNNLAISENFEKTAIEQALQDLFKNLV